MLTIFFKDPYCNPNPCKNGGKCVTANNIGFHCTCLTGFTGQTCQTKCVLFDFESGNLSGWSLTGTVFNNQPTYDDNPKYRGRADHAKMDGDWWIGGYENRSSPSDKAGNTQGDAPTGTMTSPHFTIYGKQLRFLIGGGNDIKNLCLELLIGSSVVAKETGANSETMQVKYFNVTMYRGEKARVRIVDSSSIGWGHINVDHIQDTCND